MNREEDLVSLVFQAMDFSCWAFTWSYTV